MILMKTPPTISYVVIDNRETLKNMVEVLRQLNREVKFDVVFVEKHPQGWEYVYRVAYDESPASQSIKVALHVELFEGAELSDDIASVVVSIDKYHGYEEILTWFETISKFMKTQFTPHL